MERNPLSPSRIFAEFNSERESEAGAKLPGLAGLLLASQKATWPKLNSGYEAVAQSLVRTIDCGEFSVALQFNPQRIVSSRAPVDSSSISARPCFLCPANLPEAQQGILYRRNFLLLCNPFPIFPQHYTISDLNHRPQSLEEHLGLFLHLAWDLAPSLAVFYNGPSCGASAPDHLHFQACPAGSLPIEAQLDDGRPVVPVAKHLTASIFRADRLGRAVLMIEGSAAEHLTGAIKKILSVLKTTAVSGTEPMLNLHGVFKEGKWRILLFPRQKGRPDLYDREGPERILISPASVEMGGLLVAPVERDFLRLTPELVRHIYREVSVQPTRLKEWTGRLSQLKD
jgi:hypothetical protein